MRPRAIHDPQPGFYRVRLVRGGPWVPASIYRPCPIDPDFGFPLDRSRPLCAEIDGEGVDVDRVWLSGREITAAEYRYLRALGEHARRFEPDLPAARPRERIDPLAVPLPF